jgi:acetyltransferase-like isoleucine patch superfamily enzyme
MKRYFAALRKLNFNTIRFNLRYFKLKDAVKLPVLISNHVYLRTCKGEIVIEAPLKFGMIEIGYGNVGIFDDKRDRTIWHVMGKIIFERNASIGHGSKISVEEKATLRIGENFRITANSTIFASHNIQFGKNCLLSWDILVMDSDVHKIMQNEKHLNPDKPVVVADNVWIGCRCTILKGTFIAAGSVIAAGTLLHSKLDEANTVYGGNPVKKLGTNIDWKM